MDRSRCRWHRGSTFSSWHRGSSSGRIHLVVGIVLVVVVRVVVGALSLLGMLFYSIDERDTTWSLCFMSATTTLNGHVIDRRPLTFQSGFVRAERRLLATFAKCQASRKKIASSFSSLLLQLHQQARVDHSTAQRLKG
jgi:hypothetical protein